MRTKHTVVAGLMCYFGLIWRTVQTQSTEAVEAESRGPEIQVMDPHGAGLVFRNYTRPSGPSGPLHTVCSLCFCLSPAGKLFGTGSSAEALVLVLKR